MSNYQRNPNVVACIVAVLIIGAVSVGMIVYYGGSYFNWNLASTDFHFESEVGGVNETVTLDIDIYSGGVSISFVDDESLLYDIDITVQNTTLQNEGAPTVTFTSNTIRLDYTYAGVNITLGSGVNYTIDANTDTGGISAVFGAGAHVGDVTLETTTGGIALEFTDEAIIMGNVTFALSATTGGISIKLDASSDIEASVLADVVTGSVVPGDLTGWVLMGQNYYETPNYAIGTRILDIIAYTSTGAINLDLSVS